MKKIVISLMMIAVVIGLVGAGGSIANWVEDEEATFCFDAGYLDLRLDINGTWVEPGIIPELFCGDKLEPGDSGEVTLSLHVFSDSESAALNVTGNCVDREVGCMDPEGTAGDPSWNNPGDIDGELDDYLMLFLWWDEGCIPGWQGPPTNGEPLDPCEGDNVWQEQCEPVIYDGNVSELCEYGLTGVEVDLTVCDTVYIGIAWHMMSYAEAEAAVLPSPNICMTDSLTGTITFTVSVP